MRSILLPVFFGSFLLGACSGEDGGTIRRSGTPGSEQTPDPTTQTAPQGNPTSNAVACPTDTPVAKALGNATNAADVRFSQGSVVYRDGIHVMRVKKDGTDARDIYTNADLVSSFADDTFLVTIESPDPPAAVIRIMAAGYTTPGPGGLPADDGTGLPPGGVALNPGWNAAGTYVFASDALAFYFMADVPNQGDTIYKVDKKTRLMTQLAQLQAPLGDALLSGTDVWFVRDGRRVYKVAQTAVDPTDPTKEITKAQPAQEIFAMGYADCRLAVGGARTFCSTGAALETRDLTGANMATVLEGPKAQPSFVLGPVMYGADSLFLHSLPSSAADPLKHGIRAIKVNGTKAEEKSIACGRDEIRAIAADATMVVWAENGKGLFGAPR